jgi:FkbM family methyltransferase
MNTYAQNKEDLIVLNYFKGYIGTVLDIGANNGTEFSNSKLLIENNWNCVAIEPGTVFTQLQELHKDNHKVQCYQLAIAEKEQILTFYESGAHVKNGTDSGLVSTLDYNETIRWRNNGVEFTERKVQAVPFSWVYKWHKQFDFITIDAESNDWIILQQINLSNVGCKCICIEWNGIRSLDLLFSEYMSKFKLHEISRNRENIIYAL